MSKSESKANQADGRTELPKRSVRALTEKMTVLSDSPDLFTVVSESGSEYTVDLRESVCSCADYQNREPAGGCKHIRRVKFATGREPIPWYINHDAIDQQLGLQVDENPVVAASDGGMVETSPPEETDESAESDDDRPSDCDCGDWNDGRVDTPCFPCFRKGFEEPASADDE